MWKAPGAGPVSVTAGIGVGEGVGVGVEEVQATSSNATTAKRKGKRKAFRMARSIVEPAPRSNVGPAPCVCGKGEFFPLARSAATRRLSLSNRAGYQRKSFLIHLRKLFLRVYGGDAGVELHRTSAPLCVLLQLISKRQMWLFPFNNSLCNSRKVRSRYKG